MENKAKVLLIGGTGHIGVYLCGILVAMGYEVVCTSRKRHGVDDGVRYTHGNGKDIEFVLDTVEREKPDAIVDFMHYSTGEFKSRYKKMLSKTKQYLFLSSYRVYADESPLREDSPQLLDTLKDKDYLSTDEYALAKSRQERLLRGSGRDNWTIVRPSVIYSHECFKLGCLEANVVCYRALRDLPVVMPMEMLGKQAAITWGRDAAMLIARLVLNEDAIGEDFIISSGEHVTWADIANVYKDVLGLKLKTASLDEYCRLCNRYQVLYDRMFDRRVDNSKILKVTATSPSEFTSLREGLSCELRRFINSPHYRGVNIWQNALIDRLCGTIMPLDELSLKQKLLYLKDRYALLGKVLGVIMPLYHKIRN